VTLHLSASDLASKTGFSAKQIVRFAKAGRIPGWKRISGTGPGTGFRFTASSALDEWVGRNTLCGEARGAGPGRKEKDACVPLNLRVSTERIRYKQTWDVITAELNYLAKQLPKKIRKMMSLYGCSLEQVASLNRAMAPIWALQNDVRIKLERLNHLERQRASRRKT